MFSQKKGEQYISFKHEYILIEQQPPCGHKKIKGWSWDTLKIEYAYLMFVSFKIKWKHQSIVLTTH